MDYDIFAAKKTTIPTYRCVSLTLILGLNCVSTWYVVVANVQIPRIHVDFLIGFGLYINCWHNQLCKESCSTYSHVTYSSIPSVKLTQQPRQHMEQLGPVLVVNTPPRLCSSTHTSKTHHMYFYTKMHYAVPWIHCTVAHTKLLHAWTKPPNSPSMAVHHGIGSWGKISLYVAADHETVTSTPPPAWSE
jgi:hypothetical protein